LSQYRFETKLTPTTTQTTMRHLSVFLFLIIAFSSQSTIKAQIKILSADTVIATAYSETTLQDSIYIFQGPGANGWSINMSAQGADTTGLLSDFKWDRWNANSASNWDSVKHETQKETSTITTDISGGYKLHFVNSRIDTTYYFWFYSNNLNVRLHHKKDCEEIEIQGISGGLSFTYADIHGSEPFTQHIVENGLTYNWRLDFFNEEFQDWEPLEVQPTFSPVAAPRLGALTEHKLYRFVVILKDSLGHYSLDSMIYQSIGVDANFTATYNDSIIDLDQEQIEKEAPFKVQFKNLSKNAISYEWSFWNRTESLYENGDNIWKTLYNFEPLDSLEYRIPGSYTVKLKAFGRPFIEDGIEQTCIDSQVNRTDRVDYMKILFSSIGKFPNVITPTLGSYDKPQFNFQSNDSKEEGTEPISLREMEIKIYDRGGQKVYEYRGDDDDWEGWNGKRNNTGRYVKDGVYFWVITATGWDNVEYQQRGFVHVMGTKQ